MTYTPDMQASIDRVVAGRQQRQKERFPSLLPDEKQSLLRTFHPDYVAAGFRELRIGPNKGARRCTSLPLPWRGAAASMRTRSI